MKRSVSCSLLAAALLAGPARADGTLPDLGPAPAIRATRWYDPDRTLDPGEVPGKAILVWAGALRPEALPGGGDPVLAVLQRLEELRPPRPYDPARVRGGLYDPDIEAVALFHEVEAFVPRTGKRYSDLETAVLGGSYVVSAGRDAAEPEPLVETLDRTYRVWRERREGEGIYALVDRDGRVRMVGALSRDPRALRRVTEADLRAGFRFLAEE